jgi:hypothetical protein
MGLFQWDESLQSCISSPAWSHRWSNFGQLVQIIEETRGFGQSGQAHPLAAWSRGNPIASPDHRFFIKAGGSAARGLSKPESCSSR